MRKKCNDLIIILFVFLTITSNFILQISLVNKIGFIRVDPGTMHLINIRFLGSGTNRTHCYYPLFYAWSGSKAALPEVINAFMNAYSRVFL